MQRVQGWTEQGGQSVVISGTSGSGTQYFQHSFIGATVDVYLAGTVTSATIYSDDNLTAKANPFTADATTGFWDFYAQNGRYDVRFSGGGISTPFTIGDFVIEDAAERTEYNVLDPAYGATGDGTTDDSAAIQAAIDAADTAGGGTVIIPGARTYIAGCLQLQDNVDIRGIGWPTLKVPDDAISKTINGSLDEGTGAFPSCVFLTYPSFKGDNDNTRSNDATNTTYLVSNVHVSGLILDGNKANNAVGAFTGQNVSGMGSCCCIHQSYNITFENCVMQNARNEGWQIGYTQHGGSDYCRLINCLVQLNDRQGISIITGKRCEVRGCFIFHAGSGSGVDIEGNQATEIVYEHTIDGNYIEKGISNDSNDGAFQQRCIITNNIVFGQFNCRMDNGETAGTICAGNTFINDVNFAPLVQAPISLTSSNLDATEDTVLFANNTCKGFACALQHLYNADVGHLVVRNNLFFTEYGFMLSRPINMTIEDNYLELTGASQWAATTAYAVGQTVRSLATDNGRWFRCTTAGTSGGGEPVWDTGAGNTTTDGTVTWTESGAATAVDALFGQVTTQANQGQVRFRGNVVRGSNISMYHFTTMGADPPTVDATFLQFQDNDWYASTIHADYSLSFNDAISFRQDRFHTFSKPMRAADNITEMIIDGCYVKTTGTGIDLLSWQSAVQNATIINNFLDGVRSLYILNPKFSDVSNNLCRNGYFQVDYGAGAGTNGAGASTFCNNRFINDGGAITSAFIINQAAGYDVADFGSRLDTIYGNAYAGDYTTEEDIDVTPQRYGPNATRLVNLQHYTSSLAPALVAANTTAEQTFTVTGLTTFDVVFLNKPTAQAGLGIAGVRVSAADTLAITYVNATAGGLTPSTESYEIWALRFQ